MTFTGQAVVVDGGLSGDLQDRGGGCLGVGMAKTSSRSLTVPVFHMAIA